MKAHCDSLISWVGGKKQLRRQIAELIPTDITGYVEPFGGAAWVMFYKKRWAKLEVYNDINSDLVNLFRVAKFHPEELQKDFELLIPSRELFDQVKSNPGYTDIQRAARFLHLIKRSFGSMGQHWARSKSTPQTSHETILRQIRVISQRLDKVYIENKPYDELISMYDGPDVFFFCDPPYINGYNYKLDFDHSQLQEVLAGVKGRWLLTLDDCPAARELFGDYQIVPVVRQKGINRMRGDMDYKEIIVNNF